MFHKTSLPRFLFGFFASALFFMPIPTSAGEQFPEQPAAFSDTASAKASPETEFALTVPGWLIGLDGTMGVGGLNTDISARFVDDLLPNLDMIALGGIEARRGKFGLTLEGIYAKLSVGGTSPGPLLTSVDVGMELLLAEGALTYRFLENDRAWVEFLAGARCMYLGTELSLGVDPDAVRDTSAQLSSAIFDRATEAARKEIAGLKSQAAALSAAARSQIHKRVDGRISSLKGDLGNRIDGEIGSGGPGFGNDIIGSGRVRDAIRDYVRARVASDIEAARARASAAVAGARSNARKKVKRQLDRAEKQLAKTIEKEINDRVPSSPVSGSESWVDPFVGFRGRYDLNDKWYLVGRGDIGGFGVGSDLTWNVFGALGMEVSEKIAMEAGYRYQSMDYKSGGFSWDMVFKGPFLGMRINF